MYPIRKGFLEKHRIVNDWVKYLFSTVYINRCSINFANDRIRTWVLCNGKRLLCQLSHNVCPSYQSLALNILHVGCNKIVEICVINFLSKKRLEKQLNVEIKFVQKRNLASTREKKSLNWINRERHKNGPTLRGIVKRFLS